MTKKEDDFFGKPIYTYTKEDACNDGQQARMGLIGNSVVYLTSSLFERFNIGEGKPSPEFGKLVGKICESMAIPDEEDTDYMKLRVIEEGEIWAILNGEGLTIMKPEDY